MSKIILKAIKLTKNYQIGGNTLEVIREISFEVYTGEILCIVGPSGVGKSTLLHILGTLDNPTSGNVLIEGSDVFSLPDEELTRFRNQKIGFVFQFHHLLPEFTALENVALAGLIGGGLQNDVYKKAEYILQEVGLSNRLKHKPNELSGGERQRVAVARALINQPALVLADEPSGNLDRENGERLHDLIHSMRDKKKQTFVIVTHNQKLAEQSDRIIELFDGKIKKNIQTSAFHY